MRVLIVEDNPLIAMLHEQSVAERGDEPVGPAPDVATAQTLIAEGPIDVALIDYGLEGEGTGEDVVAALGDGVDCYCIFLTGNADIVRENGSHAYGLLEKPVGPEDVTTLLSAVEADRKAEPPCWPARFERLRPSG